MKAFSALVPIVLLACASSRLPVVPAAARAPTVASSSSPVASAPLFFVQPESYALVAAPMPADVGPIAPDPDPLSTDSVFVVDLRFDHGTPMVERIVRAKLSAPMQVRTFFGRFAIELYSGPVLLQRVRFDFPLIGDTQSPSFDYEQTISSSAQVTISDSERPNRLVIWDRATERRWVFAYPPSRMPN